MLFGKVSECYEQIFSFILPWNYYYSDLIPNYCPSCLCLDNNIREALSEISGCKAELASSRLRWRRATSNKGDGTRRVKDKQDGKFCSIHPRYGTRPRRTWTPAGCPHTILSVCAGSIKPRMPLSSAAHPFPNIINFIQKAQAPLWSSGRRRFNEWASLLSKAHSRWRKSDLA